MGDCEKRSAAKRRTPEGKALWGEQLPEAIVRPSGGASPYSTDRHLLVANNFFIAILTLWQELIRAVVSGYS